MDQDLTGRIIGSYHVEARIGAGGMGEVYRAHDAKLDREVAIKVLPAHRTGGRIGYLVDDFGSRAGGRRRPAAKRGALIPARHVLRALLGG